MSKSAVPEGFSSAHDVTRFRPDIEGLRGLAVLLVLAYHACGAPFGGFVGVDVFFVISGYLITGILAREAARTGTVSIAAFYRRRARRILPSAVVVLLATVTVAFAVWFTPRALSVGLDALASALFSENWHLIAIGTDYLQATQPPSPLQHFWSLGVEEQFYGVWPVLIVLATLPAIRRRLRNNSLLVFAICLVGLSATLAALEAVYSPGTAYFDTVTRAWELGAGALVALSSPVIDRLPARVFPVLFVAGLALIGASAVFVSDAGAFPWPLAILPVLGSVLVVLAGDRSGRAGLILTNRTLREVGRISYPLYLWHFPVLIVGWALLGDGPAQTAGLVVVAVILAGVTERFVERPFRRRTDRSPRRGRTRSALSTTHPRPSRSLVLGSVAGVMLLVLGLAQLRGPVILISTSAVAEALRLPGGSVSGKDAPSPLTESDLSGRIKAADVAKTWPATLRPSLDEATEESLAPALVAGGCRNGLRDGDIEAPRLCDWGDPAASRTALVVGDSVALSWTPAIVRALGEGWRVRAVGFASCPVGSFTSGAVAGQPHFPGQCAKAQRKMLDIVDAEAPDLTIVSSAEGYLETLVPEGDESPEQAWHRSTLTTVESLARRSGRVALLQGAPTVISPEDCATRRTSPMACVGSLSRRFETKASAERTAVQDATSHGLDVRYVATATWLCDRDAHCPPFVGSTLVRPDGVHLTEEYSTQLSLVMAAALG